MHHRGPDDRRSKPLERVAGTEAKPKRKKLDRYRLERKAIVALRKRVRSSRALRRLLLRVRLGADVLLRD